MRHDRKVVVDRNERRVKIGMTNQDRTASTEETPLTSARKMYQCRTRRKNPMNIEPQSPMKIDAGCEL